MERISLTNLAKATTLSGYEALGANSRKIKTVIEALGYDAIGTMSLEAHKLDKSIEIDSETNEFIINDKGAAVNTFTAMFKSLHGVTPEEIDAFSKGLDHYLTNGVPNNIVTREIGEELENQGLFYTNTNSWLFPKTGNEPIPIEIPEDGVKVNSMKRQGKYFQQ